MKKQLLLHILYLSLCSGSLLAQSWLTVGNGLPFHFAHEYNEMTEFNGEFYTVGYFYNGISGSADAYTPIVHKLSSGEWAAVGTGFTATSNAAYTISAIAEYNSELYIGGDFLMDNGVDAVFSDVAKWDDVNDRWIPVGAGAINSNKINELTVFDGQLYAGGEFSVLGVGGTNNIAAWNGTTWSIVGSGTSTAASTGSEEADQVKSMVIYDGKLIVAGKFTTAGGTLLHNIASWDGTDWSYLKGNAIDGGGGVGGFNSGQVDIMAMTVFDNELYIGGTFTTYYNLSFIGSSTSVPNHLVVWNGTSFSAPTQATPTNTRVNAMTTFDGRVYIGNSAGSNIHSWDGGIFDWRLEPDRDPLRQRPISMYSNATELYYTDKYNIWKFSDPVPAFTSSTTFPCPGETVTFTDQSSGSNTVTAWNWTFPGGTPASSTEQNPTVTYAALGEYDVTLEVTSTDGTTSLTKKNAVRLSDDVSITLDPIDMTVCADVPVIFTIQASLFGTSGTYQWQMDDGNGFVDMEDGGQNNVSGSTGPSLSYTPTNENDGYQFRMKLTACTNEVFSTAAVLTVNELAVIDEQPVAQALCVSGDASFTVTATAGSAITYQWQYQPPVGSLVNLTDGSVITGSNTSTITLTGADNTLAELQDSDNSDGITYANFRCVLAVSGCEVNSVTVKLNIYDTPVPADPIDVTSCDTGSGLSTSFSTSVDPAISDLAYQWQVDDGTGFVNVTDSEIYSGASTSQLSLTDATSVLSGNQYRCEVGACSSPVFTSAATLSIDDQPVITSGPVNASICEGGDTEYTVVATGDNLGYQWQMRPSTGGDYTDILDSGPYFGTSSSTLQVSGVTLSMHQDRFRCVVTNGTCAVNSVNPILNVYGTPSISGRPADQTTCEGGNPVTFNQGGTNFVTSAHSYQWQEAFAGSDIFVDITDEVKFSGINDQILTILEPTFSMNGNRYRQTINGCVGEVASDPATLTVNQIPIITASPESKTICVGESVTFTASAIGTGVLYQWFQDTGDGNFSAVSSASENADYTFTAGTSDFDGYMYKCAVTAASPCTEAVETFEATLTVNETSITEEPISSATICEGEDTTFTITAEGESLTYQWYSGGSPIADDAIFSGSTTASFAITGAVSSMNSLNYHCIASGVCGDAISTTSTLFVNFAVTPEILPNLSDPANVTLTANNSNGTSFEWFLNDELHLSSTVSTISIDEEGSYTVMATANDCDSEVSAPYVYEIPDEPLGLGDAGQVSIYPNPIERFLQTDYQTDLSARVFSLDGRMMIKERIQKNASLDLESLKSGQYIIQLLDEGKLIYSGKIIKAN